MLKKHILQATVVLMVLALAVPAAWAGEMTADLAITKTADVTTVAIGDPIVYTIVATNNGPDDVTGATVTDTFEAGLDGCTWTCVASAGSSCTAAGAGDISDSVDLLNGGTATYTVTCTIGPLASGSVENTASIGSSATDPDAANSSSAASTTLGAASEIPTLGSMGLALLVLLLAGVAIRRMRSVA
jgi:uncharacterized repeat protein (TIGR01451 family)